MDEFERLYASLKGETREARIQAALDILCHRATLAEQQALDNFDPGKVHARSYAREWRIRNRKHVRRYENDRRAKLLAEGKCPRCLAPVAAGETLCEKHRQANREACRRYARKRAEIDAAKAA